MSMGMSMRMSMSMSMNMSAAGTLRRTLVGGFHMALRLSHGAAAFTWRWWAALVAALVCWG